MNRSSPPSSAGTLRLSVWKAVACLLRLYESDKVGCIDPPCLWGHLPPFTASARTVSVSFPC